MRTKTQDAGTSDGVTWRRYEWRYLPCAPTSRARFVAPHHPRLDHSLFYVSFGTGPDNFLSTINMCNRPYAFGRDSMLHRIGLALLSGPSSEIRSLFRGPDPFPTAPPKQVRVRLMAYEPLPPGEAAPSTAFHHLPPPSTTFYHLPPPSTTFHHFPQVRPRALESSGPSAA